jgi:hypothetical protein
MPFKKEEKKEEKKHSKSKMEPKSKMASCSVKMKKK